MNVRLKRFWRDIRLPLLIAVGVATFLYFIVPIANWLIVDKTIAVYSESRDRYAMDNDVTSVYEGEIVDTIVTQSTKIKGKIDTTIHRQTIRIVPPEKLGDEKPRREDVGVFGDSAGLLNALFSFMAFIAVLVTIWLQRNKDGNDKRNAARLQFEQEFFAMVGMLEEIVAHLKFTDHENVENAKTIDKLTDDLLKGYGIAVPEKNNHDEAEKYKPIVVEGREVFEYLYKDRKNYNLLKYVNSEDPNSSYSSEEAQRLCYDGTLDHYFRYLYRILKHIDESELLEQLDDTETEREKYAHLLRAQLSNYELLMWFYNGLLGDEHPRTVKKLIERYAMFNNLRAWELGKNDSVYYQSILDEEMYEDPEGFNQEKTYSVYAFWDDKKIREFRRKKKNKNSIARLLEGVKERFANKKQRKLENKEQLKKSQSDSNPQSEDAQTKNRTSQNFKREQKQNGKKAKKEKGKKSKKIRKKKKK